MAVTAQLAGEEGDDGGEARVGEMGSGGRGGEGRDTRSDRGLEGKYFSVFGGIVFRSKMFCHASKGLVRCRICLV